MKKLLGILLFISTLAGALNFSGHQSLNGLGRTSIFTAPASGSYFIDGKLSLPQPSLNGNTGASQATAVVSKNNVTVIYTGLPGANGFGINAVTLATNDAISVSITSNATIDQGLNVIKGDVFFGNN